MVSFFGYWGAFSFPSGFDGWLFRFRPRFLRSGSSFASFRLNGGLRDSLFVLRSGWSSVFPLSCSRLFSPACRSVYWFFFVLYPASVSYGFVLRFSSGAYAFRLFFLSFAFRWFLGRLRFSSSVFPLGGFMSFVRPQVSFIDLSASFSWLCLSSSFPVPHSFSLFRLSLRLRFPLPVLFPRAACVFLSVSWISIAVRPFRLRSPIPPLRITSSQCAIGRRRRAYRPRLSASSRTASSRVAWRRWSR